MTLIIHRNAAAQIAPDGYDGPPLTAAQLADIAAGHAPRVYSEQERQRIRDDAAAKEAARLAAIKRTAPMPDPAIHSIGDVLKKPEVKE